MASPWASDSGRVGRRDEWCGDSRPCSLFRQYAGKIFIHPVPASGSTIVYEYMKSQWITDPWAWPRTFTADTDLVVFDEELLETDATWRIRKSMGTDYTEEFNDAEEEIEAAISQDGGRRTLNLSRAGVLGDHFLGANVAEGSWSL